jgi:hypothetical protein
MLFLIMNLGGCDQGHCWKADGYRARPDSGLHARYSGVRWRDRLTCWPVSQQQSREHRRIGDPATLEQCSGRVVAVHRTNKLRTRVVRAAFQSPCQGGRWARWARASPMPYPAVSTALNIVPLSYKRVSGSELLDHGSVFIREAVRLIGDAVQCRLAGSALIL